MLLVAPPRISSEPANPTGTSAPVGIVVGSNRRRHAPVLKAASGATLLPERSLGPGGVGAALARRGGAYLGPPAMGAGGAPGHAVGERDAGRGEDARER